MGDMETRFKSNHQFDLDQQKRETDGQIADAVAKANLEGELSEGQKQEVEKYKGLMDSKESELIEMRQQLAKLPRIIDKQKEELKTIEQDLSKEKIISLKYKSMVDKKTQRVKILEEDLQSEKVEQAKQLELLNQQRGALRALRSRFEQMGVSHPPFEERLNRDIDDIRAVEAEKLESTVQSEQRKVELQVAIELLRSNLSEKSEENESKLRDGMDALTEVEALRIVETQLRDQIEALQTSKAEEITKLTSELIEREKKLETDLEKECQEETEKYWKSNQGELSEGQKQEVEKYKGLMDSKESELIEMRQQLAKLPRIIDKQKEELKTIEQDLSKEKIISLKYKSMVDKKTQRVKILEEDLQSEKVEQAKQLELLNQQRGALRALRSRFEQMGVFHPPYGVENMHKQHKPGQTGIQSMPPIVGATIPSNGEVMHSDALLNSSLQEEREHQQFGENRNLLITGQNADKCAFSKPDLILPMIMTDVHEKKANLLRKIELLKYPKVPPWGGKSSDGKSLRNTCTVDNFLTIMHVTSVENPGWIQSFENTKVTMNTLKKCLTLMAQGNFADAKVEWIGLVKPNMLKIKEIDTYGSEYEMFSGQIKSLLTTSVHQICSNSSCPIKESKQFGFCLPIHWITQSMTIQELWLTWLSRHVEDCEVSLPNTSTYKDKKKCNGKRQTTVKVFGEMPFVLAIPVWEYVKYGKHSKDITSFSEVLDIQQTRYILIGITLYRQEHYVSCIKSTQHGWLFYDDLKGKLKPFSKQYVLGCDPENLVYLCEK